MSSLRACEACLEENSKNLTKVGYIWHNNWYLEQCEKNPDAAASQIGSLLASLSSMDASRTALQTELAALGYNSSTPATSMTTEPTTLPTETAGLPATIPDPAPEAPPTTTRNLGVIIPAVVIPVVLIPLISLLAACLVMRRRRRRRLEYELRAAGPSPFEGKAQFHGAFKPELDAVSTIKSAVSPSLRDSAGEIAELPAMEPIALEMDGSVGASASAR
ncbi:hypothetical protein BDV19DRAFT_387895 [Aspergillus venezuelensis]